MLFKIIDFSVRNKLIVGLLTIGLAVWGIYSLTKLPIDAVPDITENQVQVITISPSLGATDVERQITIPIELANRNIPGLKQVRSFSRFGLSLVTLVFDDETDIYWARQQVSERLIAVQAQIPPGIGMPELAPMSTGLGEIYQYVVRPKPGYENRYTAKDLRTIQDHIVRKQLLGTPGVADVSSFGGELKQYEIAVNPQKLAAAGLGMEDIFTALEKNNQNTGGSYIEHGPTVLFIRSEGLIKTEEDIERISISRKNGQPSVLIKDVAEVTIGHATRFGAMCYNDKGEVAGAVVMMLKGENSSRVIKAVKKKVEEINQNLPEGIQIEPFLDRTKMVDNAIGTVEKNLMEGALIVIFVLVLFLGNLRAGLIVASVIPLSMLFAVSMMNLFGVSGNLMSLGAIDFGLIVDGGVIIVESVMHKLHHSAITGGNRKINASELDEEVKTAAGKMMNSAAFGQIIILMVYLPILTLQGIEGKMFKPMAETVAFALIGALIFSLTYVPMASSLFLSKNLSAKATWMDRAMNWLQGIYKPSLITALNRPVWIISSALALFFISVFLLTRMGGEFIPELEEGDFAVETRVLPGSNLSTTIASTQKAAGILLERFPEIEKIVTKIGSAEIPTDPMPPEASDLMVILKDKKEWTSAETFDELAEKMTEALKEVPGITVGFQFPVQMRFNELMTGSRQDIVCKLFGENLDSLAKYATQIGEIIPGVEGAKDLYVETVTGMPQMVAELNRDALTRYGISVNEVNRALKTAFAGETAGYVFEGEKRFDLVVRMEKDLRQNPEQVKNLLIKTPDGNDVPLYELADVKIKEGPYQIQRENAARRITIGFNVRGRDVQSVVEELKSKIDSSIPLPPGYSIHYGGQFENLNAAKSRLAIAVPAALLLILILLYFAFNSLKQGLLIFTAIPLSAIGGVFALLIRQMPFSISAGVGFIALFGVAVLNGIVLIAEFNRLKKEGLTDLKEIVLKGTEIRLRPVLMTAAVASLGFLPMALSHGAGAEVQRPLASVVIGGLITSTLLTLLVLPVIYVMAEKFTLPTKKIILPVMLIFLFSTGTLSAQISGSITLNDALSKAEKENYSILAAEENEKLKKTAIQSAADIPKADIAFQYGQYNSAFSDYQLGISQKIAFPLVYVAQNNWLKSEYVAAGFEKEVTKNEIRRKIRSTFYAWQILHEKEKLLLYSDSLFREYASLAALRLKVGESGLLEKISAENLSRQASQQISAIRTEKTNCEILLSSLIRSSEKTIPVITNPKMPDEGKENSALFPVIKWREQMKLSAEKMRSLEKSRLYPDLQFGYNNTGITGFQNVSGTDIYYGPRDRFSFITAGLSIPLFFGSQAAKIQAASFAVSKAEQELSAEKTAWETEQKQTALSLENFARIIREYESTILPDAEKTTALVNQKLQAGEISFPEWFMLISQTIQLKNDYLNYLGQFNETLINQMYLNAQ